MSIQNDLLNGDNSKVEPKENEEPEFAKKCPNRQGDVVQNFPKYEDDAH